MIGGMNLTIALHGRQQRRNPCHQGKVVCGGGSTPIRQILGSEVLKGIFTQHQPRQRLAVFGLKKRLERGKFDVV